MQQVALLPAQATRQDRELPAAINNTEKAKNTKPVARVATGFVLLANLVYFYTSAAAANF
ncbi:hypothetical protein GCM10027443_28600 [Pontibacter brevis]